MKVFYKALAACKVAWREREALKEALAAKCKLKVQNVALCTLLALLMMVVVARVTDQTRPPERIDLAAAAIVEAQQESEAEKALQIAQEQAQHRAEAEAVAKVLYGTALHHSEEAQRAVVWCIINRCESSLFPDSIVQVCKQPVQWMGYSDGNPVIESLYQIADEVLCGWRSGGYRVISPDYLYLSWTRDSIILRTSFEENSRTHYWEVG